MEYTSLRTFEIKGRGKGFVVSNEKNRDRDENDLLGKEVVIDGKKYKVKGIESFALPWIRKGQEIGIFVE